MDPDIPEAGDLADGREGLCCFRRRTEGSWATRSMRAGLDPSRPRWSSRNPGLFSTPTSAVRRPWPS